MKWLAECGYFTAKAFFQGGQISLENAPKTSQLTTLFVSNPYVLKVVRTAAVCFLLQDAEAFGNFCCLILLDGVAG